MKKLVILSFMTLDGVMQAPGGPEEDTSGGFKYGGWVFPLFDDVMMGEMLSQMNHDFDLLLGRKTYEIFASYWPFQDVQKDPIAASFNKTHKYVVSKSLKTLEWSNSSLVNGNIPEQIRKIKEEEGPEIQVHGSTNLIQTLWLNDLVDELWLKTFPVAVGSGKRLFENDRFAGGFELFDFKTTPSGVIIGYYRRSGAVKTGTIGS